MRIALLMENRENARLLREVLSTYHDVAAVEGAALADAPFDLLIVDAPMLSRHREAIASRKASAVPAFLPIMVLVLRRDSSLARQELWKTLDELLFLPIEKVEVQARVEVLLRARRYSLELATRVGHLEELIALKRFFFEDVVHDLRTPLTAIMGFTELLEDEAGLDRPARRSYVDGIVAGAKRLDALVTDLGVLSKIERGKLELTCEEVDLGRLLAAVARDVAPIVEAAGLSLRVDAPSPLMVLADLPKLERVIVNLVGNAIKFTPKGGAITVSAGVEGEGVGCTVEDTGIGIPLLERAKLFKRYAQLEVGARKGGSGLGLFISKEIVEAHGGEIGVESASGGGARFHFRLPRLRPTSPSPGT